MYPDFPMRILWGCLVTMDDYGILTKPHTTRPGKRLQFAMERSTIFYGKIHSKWQFSIAMLNYQRVNDMKGI